LFRQWIIVLVSSREGIGVASWWGTYFLKVNLLGRSSRVLVDEVASVLAAVGVFRERMPFRIGALGGGAGPYALRLAAAADDGDYFTRWRMIRDNRRWLLALNELRVGRISRPLA
jgi:hypothetical protein